MPAVIAAEVEPRQVRGDVAVLSIWAGDIDDPTWLICHLDNPDWAHTMAESKLLAIPQSGWITEDDRLRFCHKFFDKIMK